MDYKDNYRYKMMLDEARRMDIPYFVMGILITGMFGFIDIMMIKDWKPHYDFPLILTAPLVLLGLGLIVVPVINFFKPEWSLAMRRAHKDNLELLINDLENNEIYKDGFFHISDLAIVSTYNPLFLTQRSDVLAAWISTRRKAGVTMAHVFELYTVNSHYIIRIPYEQLGGNKQIYLTMMKYCPNCMFGYSPETRKYIKEMRKKLKSLT